MLELIAKTSDLRGRGEGASPACRPLLAVALGALVLGCSTVSEAPGAADGGDSAAVEVPEAAAPTSSVPEASPPPPDGGRPPKGCTKPDDCTSKVCVVATGVCAPAACADRTKNQDETDVDCGGRLCPGCKAFSKCLAPLDCESGVCSGGECQPPTCSDAIKNGAETDQDCGGDVCGKCADGRACGAPSDCESDVCTAGVCATPACDDGTKNGSDTDIDCGGPLCPRCADTLRCLTGADCLSDECEDRGMGLRCQAPSCTDGRKNGAETDVDCGGTCPGCATGKTCLVGADCASQGCNYAKVCAAGRSCTAHYGGDTCGTGGEGGVGPKAWEDCCTTAPVELAGGVQVKLDKYPVTAGRMRAFLTSVGYNVRNFVLTRRGTVGLPTLPGAPGVPVLAPEWDSYLPSSFGGDSNFGERSGCAERDCLPLGSSSCTCTPGTSFRGIYTAASRHVGGFIFQGNAQSRTGCFVGGPGTHAYRFPNGAQDGPPPEVNQDTYDTKTMNCVDYLVGQAFCVWDGGRLETIEEWQAAFGRGPVPWSATDARLPARPEDRGLAVARGDQTYWGCRFPWATDSSHPACSLSWNTAQHSIEYAAFQYTYEYPKLLGSDYIVFIPAPGRTTGRGAFGHSDLLGDVQEMTSTVTVDPSPFEARHAWTGNGSWDIEDYDRNASMATMLLNKTSRLGLRCAHP